MMRLSVKRFAREQAEMRNVIWVDGKKRQKNTVTLTTDDGDDLECNS